MEAVMGDEQKCWIAVACAAHVRGGLAGGFMQVCHGKGGPLRRVRPGDRIAYYSPTETLDGGAPLKAFTAIGTVEEGSAYQADTGNGFLPFRRDVRWSVAHPAPIQPLLNELAFTAGKRNWGYQLRFGLIEVDAEDLEIIAGAMDASDA
ncbi:EVE domain-containing protein [Neorhizobium galegae]|nr:EVE domain-containing protein [Neorhizobium galegae]